MPQRANRLVDCLRAMVDPARHETAADPDLLARWVAQRDERAFAALVWRHGPLVWRVARNVLHQTEDAEDVFQAAFLVLARKAPGLRRQPSLAGWLYHTAHRLALKARTMAVRRRRRENLAACQAPADPLEEISAREARSVLAEELDRLSAVYREPLLLCLYEGATQDEAARQLGCSLNTLKRRLERGRELLARRLGGRGLAPAGALALTLCSPSPAPALLVQQTITAAAQFTAGHAISGAACGLAQHLLRTILLKKLAVYLSCLCALASVTLAAGVTYGPAASAPAAKRSAAPPPQAKDFPKPPRQSKAVANEPRLDRLGDPMPPEALNRLGSGRLRHGAGMSQVSWTPDGKSLVAVSTDGSLRLWDAATGKLRWRFEIDKASSYQSVFALSPDGKKLAVLSDFDYHLLATDTGKSILHYEWPKAKGNDDRVRCLAIAPDLSTFARGCLDATVRLYDAATGQENLLIAVGSKLQNEFPWGLEFSANSKRVYTTVYDKPGIMPLDVVTGKVAGHVPFKTGRRPAQTLRVSSAQGLLAGIVEGDPDAEKPADLVIVWDLATGNVHHQLQVPSAHCCAFSPDGSLLAAGFDGIVLFDITTGKEKGRLDARPGVLSLAFAPDGKTIAAADYTGCITLWDVATGKLLPPSPEPRSGYFTGLHFLGTGNELRSFGDGVAWWDVASGKISRHWRGEPAQFPRYGAASISPDEKMVVASSFEHLPDGKFKSDILLVDAATDKTVQTLAGHTWAICSTLFSPDGTKLFSAAGYDPRVMVWDVANGKSLQILESHTYFADRLAVSPDGRWLASASSQSRREDHDIRLWEIATGKLVRRLTPRLSNNLRVAVFAMVFSADSSLLLSGGGDVQIWDVASGKEVRVISGSGLENDFMSSLAVTPDGRMLATGSSANLVQIWELATGTKRRIIKGHDGMVDSVTFSSNGRLLASSSFDAPIYIWDVYGRDSKQAAGAKVTKEEKQRLWQRLADADGAVAFLAICDLIAHPAEAVPMLEDGWKRSARATAKQIEKWMDDVNSDQFAVRNAATGQLQQLLTGHEELLRKAIEKAGSLEVRQRLEQILARPNPERLRRTRMLEILEQIATSPARRLLQALAEQKDDPQLASEAAASLKRLS